jgi:hypothetical protein
MNNNENNNDKRYRENMEAANNRAGRAGVMANKLGGNQMREAQELAKNVYELEGINRTLETNKTNIKQNKHHTTKKNLVFKNETVKTNAKLYNHENSVAAKWRQDSTASGYVFNHAEPHRSVNSFR